MPALNRVLFNVLCKDLSASVTFYRQLLDLETTYESEWFVTLSPKGQPEIVIGLIDQVSQFTPRHAWGMHEGTYLTFVVDDVYEVLDRAQGARGRGGVGAGGARLWADARPDLRPQRHGAGHFDADRTAGGQGRERARFGRRG